MPDEMIMIAYIHTHIHIALGWLHCLCQMKIYNVDMLIISRLHHKTVTT